MENKVIPYDLFKLVILIALLMVLAGFLNFPFFALESEQDVVEETQIGEMGLAVSTENPVKELPAFPFTDKDLSLNADENGLVDEYDAIAYSLSEDRSFWVPVIPNEMRQELPKDYVIAQDESAVWQIASADGEALFLFDEVNLEWMVVYKTETLSVQQSEDKNQDFNCPLANPIRIAASGEKVRVVNVEIPLRSSPKAGSQNFMIEMPPGTTLEIVGAPICVQYLNGANVWWLVRTSDGLEGYAAEGSAVSDVYYLETIEE